MQEQKEAPVVMRFGIATGASKCVKTGWSVRYFLTIIFSVFDVPSV